MNARYLDLVIRLYTDRSSVERAEIHGFVEDLPQASPVDIVTLLEIYALAGMQDAAFELLGQVRRNHHPFIVGSMTTSPLLKSLHQDPRWRDLMEYAGVAPHQLAQIEFDPTLPTTGSE